MSAHDYTLGLAADDWDHTYCDECGDIRHRADIDDGVCEDCRRFMRDEEAE